MSSVTEQEIPVVVKSKEATLHTEVDATDLTEINQKSMQTKEQICKEHSWIKRFPNTGIGPALGLAGNSILWNTMSKVEFTSGVGTTVNWITSVGGFLSWLGAVLIWVAKFSSKDTREMAMIEWNHPIRCYFFVAGLDALLMLLLGMPDSIWDQTFGRVMCLICIATQMFFTSVFYSRWMYSTDGNLSKAGAPFLLSVVGWFLLTILCLKSKIEGLVGVNLASWMFGCGTMFGAVSYISVFQGFHLQNTGDGHPSHFLLLAPASVMSTALGAFRGGFDEPSQAIFGFCLMMLIILIKLGMKFFTSPSVFGVYWAFVFPIAAFAGSSVKMAEYQDTRGAKIVSWAIIAFSQSILLGVFFRMSAHHIQVMRGKEFWNDPLFDSYLKKKDLEVMELKKLNAPNRDDGDQTEKLGDRSVSPMMTNNVIMDKDKAEYFE